MLQHAFNTLSNQMSGAFEQLVQHCWKYKQCWKLVEANLNCFKLSFNIDSTFPLLSQMLSGVEAVWTLRSTFAQHPFNVCWTNVGQILKPFKRALILKSFKIEKCTSFFLVLRERTTQQAVWFESVTQVGISQRIKNRDFLYSVINSTLHHHNCHNYCKQNQREFGLFSFAFLQKCCILFLRPRTLNETGCISEWVWCSTFKK